MNKNKKFISIFSIMLLVVSLFAGCSSKETSSSNKEEQKKIKIP